MISVRSRFKRLKQRRQAVRGAIVCFLLLMLASPATLFAAEQALELETVPLPSVGEGYHVERVVINGPWALWMATRVLNPRMHVLSYAVLIYRGRLGEDQAELVFSAGRMFDCDRPYIALDDNGEARWAHDGQGIIAPVGKAVKYLIALPGKRVCAWYCPCGGLADPVADEWRHKAPRGNGVRRI